MATMERSRLTGTRTSTTNCTTCYNAYQRCRTRLGKPWITTFLSVALVLSMIRSTVGFQPFLKHTLWTRRNNGLFLRRNTNTIQHQQNQQSPMIRQCSKRCLTLGSGSTSSTLGFLDTTNGVVGDCIGSHQPRKFNLWMSNQRSDSNDYNVVVGEEDDDFFEEEDNFLDIDDAQIKEDDSSTSGTDGDSDGDEPPPKQLDDTLTQYTKKKSNLDVSDSNDFFNKAEQDADCINYPKGFPEGFYVVHHYTAPSDGFDMNAIHPDTTSGDGDDDIRSDGTNTNTTCIIHEKEIIRSSISSTNMTLPHALMLLDPIEYPSLSRARKACRKGYILIHRGALDCDANGEQTVYNPDKTVRGRTADRVFPSDIIGKQVRMHGGFYPGMNNEKPPFELPVVYEDDHFAVVNKPAGIVVYSQRHQGHNQMTVRSALPYALKPPKRGTFAIIRRPASVHRLDKPTSGLLLVAKTKPAMVDLTKQFVERRIKKTYTAVINGIPDEPIETSISAKAAHELGVDVDSASIDDGGKWQLIDFPLDEKSAVTVWRPKKYVKSLTANDGTVTLVELKPKSGRYHQLRRHMAWVRDCPIIGDKAYDGGGNAMKLRGRGLFLCSNKVCLDHPYYNTEIGREEWESLPDEEKWADDRIRLSEDGKIVQVHISIPLPSKFEGFLRREEERVNKLADNE